MAHNEPPLFIQFNLSNNMNNFFLNPNDNNIYAQYQQMMQNQQQTVDTYANLEKEMQTLSDSDVIELSRFQPYIQANNALSMLVQGELLKMVRNEVNKQPEVINNVINSIKEFKSMKQKDLDDFQDYIKNYSDITYKEYKQLKEKNK